MKRYCWALSVALLISLSGCTTKGGDCLAVITSTTRAPTIVGVVSSINAGLSQFTLATGPPTVCVAQTLTIKADGTTTYEHVNHASSQFSDIKVGDSLTVTGDFNASSIFVATHIVTP